MAPRIRLDYKLYEQTVIAMDAFSAMIIGQACYSVAKPRQTEKGNWAQGSSTGRYPGQLTAPHSISAAGLAACAL